MAKKQTSIFKKIFIGLFIIFFLALLGISAFAASIYFGVLDSEKVAWVNEKVGLYKLPFIGAGEDFEYFSVPEGVVWPPPPEPEPVENPPVVAENKPPAPAPEPPKKEEDKKSKDVKVSQKEVEEQMKAREAAEKKRISKLARIYDNMKPEEAAKALNDVSLDTVFILKKFFPY